MKQNDMESGSKKSKKNRRKGEVGVRLRSWGNSFGDLMAFILGKVVAVIKALVRPFTGPKGALVRSAAFAVVVLLTVGVLFFYSSQQMGRFDFSGTSALQPESQSESAEVPAAGQPFSSGKVSLGVSEEDLNALVHESQEAATETLARTGQSLGFPEQMSEEALAALSLSKLVWPLQGKVSQDYGWWRHPMFRDWRMHTGVSIDAPIGTTAHSALPGRVTQIYHDNFLRNVVVIEHSGQIRSVYGNLQDIAVTLGSSVAQGRVLGRISPKVYEDEVGELYFELRQGGEPVDPLAYLR